MASGGLGDGEALTVATVLAIDCSWDASLHEVFPALKSAAIALDSAVRERYPDDILHIIDYAAYAIEISRKQLADLSQHENILGTNMHAVLLLAQEILSARNASPRQILILAGSEPSAHLERGRSYYAWPPTPITMRQTIASAQRCVADGFPVTVLWVGDTPDKYASAFHDRLAAEAGVQTVEVDTAELADAVVEAHERGRFAPRGA